MDDCEELDAEGTRINIQRKSQNKKWSVISNSKKKKKKKAEVEEKIGNDTFAVQFL